MKTKIDSRRYRYAARFGILLVAIALIAGMMACEATNGPDPDPDPDPDPVYYALSISSTDGGEVTTPGEGPMSYQGGTMVDLVAQPYEGYSFLAWTGDVVTIADVNDAETTIIIEGNYSITATFFQGQLIRDWHDLYNVRQNLSGHYALMNDLDSTTGGYDELAGPEANDGAGWGPLAGDWMPFDGTFSGQGYEIRELVMNRPGVDDFGLFGVIGSGGRIEDVGVVNADVAGRYNVGILGVNSGGTIVNSYTTGSVTGEGSVGGLLGTNGADGTVSNCYSTAEVHMIEFVGTGHGRAGGLVGENLGILADSYATGSISIVEDPGLHYGFFVGGLAGRNGGTISNCYATGTVIGNQAVGGLVGHNQHTITGSYATGSVTGGYSNGLYYGSVGGLVGLNMPDLDLGTESTISDSYATGSVTGLSGEEWFIGGFAGVNYYGMIISCYSTGSVHYEGVADPTDKGFAGDCTGGYQEMPGNFWDVESSGQTSTGCDATGTTSAKMKDFDTFNTARWDICRVSQGQSNTLYAWNIVDGESYPFLSWELVS